MSKIKNDGLDQYGAGPFEQQQFGTSGVEGVNVVNDLCVCVYTGDLCQASTVCRWSEQ